MVENEIKSTDRTGLATREDAEQELEHFDSSRFSLQALSKLKEKVAEYITMLTTESMKLSRRHQADTVSAADVERASEYLTSNPSNRILRRVGTMGGVFLGASISHLVSMTAANSYTTRGVLITATLGIVGAFLVALHERRD